MQSSDNFHAERRTKQSEGLLPAHRIESRTGRAGPNDYEAPDGNIDTSKWIHRDKLARIENEELQAAGFFVPRSRAASKQRRDRSQASYRRGTDASEQSNSRSRKNSSAVEQHRAVEPSVPAWDLRTPEEIAEEEANAYFAANAGKNGSRIPVAKTSRAPISPDYLERSSPAAGKQTDSSEGETLSMAKTRSRSASASGKEVAPGTSATGALSPVKRSATDVSPKKAAGTTGSRKASAASKPPTSTTPPARPKTRSGSTGGTGTRPSTRSGEKQLEGDPPWMVNAYKPDPRLPPDQQLLPTVARRLQQEQWEKEGKFGDVYDKEFRPLNDNVFLRPAEPEASAAEEEQKQPQSQQTPDEWPLRPEAAAKSPTLRQGSYSTMPKISDKPPNSPAPRPKTPMTSQQQSGPKESFQRMPQEQEAAPKKGGCGCCIVM